MKKEFNIRMNLLAKAVTVLVLFAMVMTAFMPVPAVKAATKQTMYVGEAFEYYISGSTITSVSSSNKKVVKASKNKDRRFSCNLEAKKAGSATVTVKYKDYSRKSHTYKLKITVKKLDVKVSLQQLDSGYALLKVKNNTNQIFDSVSVRYTFKDSSGETVKEDTMKVPDVLSGKTAYATVFVGRDIDVDYTKSAAKATDGNRDPQYTYKNVSLKNLDIEKKDETEDGNYIRFKLKIKNKMNKDVKVINYLFSYDAQGNIINAERCPVNLNKKETKTTYEYSVSRSSYSHPTFDHYEIVTQAYMSERKK